MQDRISTFRDFRFRFSLIVWRSVWFRYLALWCARRPKRFKWLAATLALACLAAEWYRHFGGAFWGHPFKELSERLWLLWVWLPVASWSGLGKAAAGLFLVWLFAWAFSVRKRIFVAPFEDYSGDSSLKDFVAGLPPLLLNELSRIRQIHQDARESGAYSSGDKAVQPSISVQNVGETLESAVTKDSKVSLGFVSFPIGAMFGIFGKTALQGPKLSGSVHKQDGVVTLIARMEGGGFANTDWRVDSRDVSAQDSGNKSPALTQLVEQLAYRIFTDLIPTGSKRWEAVSAFSQGLKHLRTTNRTETDYYWNLRQAEARFIEALSWDNKFGTCYYNLGVVYERLNEQDSARKAYAESARKAYTEAVRQEPEFAPSYYALGANRLSAVQYAECIRYCDQAIELDPDLARAWDAKGLAYRWMKDSEPNSGQRSGSKTNLSELSAKARSYAAAIAWRALCRCDLTGPVDRSEGAKAIAVKCLRGHAVGQAVFVNLSGSGPLFRQALYLSPADADIHFEYGKTLFQKGRYSAAARHFTRAIGIDAKPLYWAWLAKTQVEARCEIRDVKESLFRTLAGCWTGDTLNPDIRDIVRKISNYISVTARGESIPGQVPKNQKSKQQEIDYATQLKEFRDSLDVAFKVAGELKWMEPPQEDEAQYLNRIENILPLDRRRGWNFSNVIEALQKRLSDDEAKRLVQAAAQALLQEKGLDGIVAAGFLNRKSPPADPRAALPHAERAVALNPFEPNQRYYLAQVYSALGDWERAEAEWKIYLDRFPTDSGAFSNVAVTYWNRGVYRLEPERRKEMFQRVVETLKRAIKISDSVILSSDKDQRDGQIDFRGGTHFTLGKFQKDLLNYDDAVSELMKARSLGYQPLLASLWLADGFMEAKAYDRAEDALREGVRSRNTLRVIARKLKEPLLPSAQAQGSEMSANEQSARYFFTRASAWIGSEVNLRKAKRIAEIGYRFASQVPGSEQKQLKAIYFKILGSLAFKSDDVTHAIEQFKQSISMFLDEDCYMRLAEAYLAQARSGTGMWQQSIDKARYSLQSADTVDVRGRLAGDVATLKARIDQVELENKERSKIKSTRRPLPTSAK